MPTTLQELVSAYLADEAFQKEARTAAQSRNSNLPHLKSPVQKFASSSGLKVSEFLEQIETYLDRHNVWLAEGNRFLHDMRILSGSSSEAEERLRELLLNLNNRNLGERIEQFANYLQKVQNTIPVEKRKERNFVRPERAAFLLSLVACWFRSSKDKTIIYYRGVLRGLRLLLDQQLVEQTHGLHIAGETIVVLTQNDHRAVSKALQEIIEAAPALSRIDIGPYEPEFFLRWFVENEVWKEDETFIAQEIRGRTIEHQALRHLTDGELADKIAEVRQHVLVNEDTIRRIYEALLAGHVILTGPPGTGKTELARLIPEILWSEPASEDATRKTGGYATRLVTASDGWSVHTLLGGLVPKSIDGQVHYNVRYGHLTDTIRKNWLARMDRPHLWGYERISVHANSQLNGQEKREFNGIWLVIDEFNRAPIDLALGEAMTTLSGGNGHSLHILTDDGYCDLPLPRDFRILGTLNSFDRNYLNQISEALKRRFTFVDVPPPGRDQWNDEQTIVLRKTFAELEQFGLEVTRNGNITAWRQRGGPDPDQFVYQSNRIWGDQYSFMATLFEQAWDIFDVIRVYRRLGTAQAIALIKQIFIKVLFRNIDESRRATAIDEALCDVIADQLQILMRDELNVLYSFCRGDDKATFTRNYHERLKNLAQTSSRRLRAQLEALSMMVDEDGNELLTEQEVERLAGVNEPVVSDEILAAIFHLDEARPALPLFTRRLRTLRSEHRL